MDNMLLLSQFLLSIVVIATISWYISSCLWRNKKSRSEELPLPPGPWGFPLLGYLPFLKPDVHRQLVDLARTYGPIMKIQLGGKLCVVVSTPSMAERIMRDHDSVFANRNQTAAFKAFFYNGSDIAFAPNGPQWRLQRKIWSSQLMSHSAFASYYNLRRDEVGRMVRSIYEMVGTPICIRKHMYLTAMNVAMGMLWGGTLEGKERDSMQAQFLQVVEKAERVAGTINLSDIFPWMAWFDFQGVERSSKRSQSGIDKIFDYIIEQGRKMNKVEEEKNGVKKEARDFLQVLLRCMDAEDPKMRLTLPQVKGMLMDMVAGGTDPLTSSMEWAMAELMQHPEVMRKVQEELDQVVGKNNKVDGSHFPNLRYLDAVFKEALRLHPVAPLLVPRAPSQSCAVGDYMIPKGTQILINAWGIHRDPKAWVEPCKFKPERFLDPGCKFDYSGNDFHYIPFGSGRRICAGAPFAEKMTMHVLASLLHSFEWRLPEGDKHDLVERFGITLKKTSQLVIVPTPRLSNPDLYF